MTSLLDTRAVLVARALRLARKVRIGADCVP
jgi:hypothetical protein